jgi:hypothetical protein
MIIPENNKMPTILDGNSDDNFNNINVWIVIILTWCCHFKLLHLVSGLSFRIAWSLGCHLQSGFYFILFYLFILFIYLFISCSQIKRDTHQQQQGLVYTCPCQPSLLRRIRNL